MKCSGVEEAVAEVGCAGSDGSHWLSQKSFFAGLGIGALMMLNHLCSLK